MDVDRVSRLPERLGVRPGARVALVDAPANFRESLRAQAPGAVLVSDEDSVDIIVCFSVYETNLAQRLAELKPRLAPSGVLWVAWPRKLPGEPRNYIEDHIRETGLAAGFVDTTVSGLDGAWSGIRFVIAQSPRPVA